MTTNTTKSLTATGTSFRLAYIDSDGTRQNPALDDDADLFETEDAAWAASEEFEADNPDWAGTDWRVEEEASSMLAIMSYAGEISVDAATGGRWRPNADAAKEIHASSSPLRAGVAMCVDHPMRGEWSS